jgi:hypothetical protein
MSRLIVFFALVGLEARGQGNPVAAQFERLMGRPKEVVNYLVNFPWKAELPDELPGLRRVSSGQTIRIASVEQAVRAHSRWQRWESEDGNVWVDLVTFTERNGASETLRSAR